MQDSRCVGNHKHNVKLRPKDADAKVAGESRSSYATGLFDLGSAAIRQRDPGVQANRARQGQQWTARHRVWRTQRAHVGDDADRSRGCVVTDIR
jgi:hypothetical protein